MTVREACQLLGCSLRQLHYILQAAGIPGGERTRAGTLTPRAADAVRAILAARQPAVQSVVQNGATPWELARLSEACEHLYAETIYLREKVTWLENAAELAYRANAEVAAAYHRRLAALEDAEPVRVTWYARMRSWIEARRAVVLAETVAARRQMEYPATEVYEGNVLRRA